MLVYPYKNGFDVLKFENFLYFLNQLKLTENKNKYIFVADLILTFICLTLHLSLTIDK